MQTIKYLASKYLFSKVVWHKPETQNIEDAFASGMLAAQKWIDVKEEKPELRVPVLVKMSYNFFNTDIPAKDCCYWDGESWIDAIRQQHSNGSVTHWRPIEYPLL